MEDPPESLLGTTPVLFTSHIWTLRASIFIYYPCTYPTYLVPIQGIYSPACIVMNQPCTCR